MTALHFFNAYFCPVLYLAFGLPCQESMLRVQKFWYTCGYFLLFCLLKFREKKVAED